MMVHDLKHKNKPSQEFSGRETLFGWFPGGQEAPRYDSREIYIKLGSRPPREQSFYESDILYQYHQSLNPYANQRDFSSKQTPSEALNPPWSLHVQTIQNTQDNEEELNIQSKNLNRAKSAPNVPSHRIILKIPNPILNIFDANETFEEKQARSHNETNANNNSFETNIRPKTSFNAPLTPSQSVTPDRYMLTKSNLNDSRNSFTDINSQSNSKGTKSTDSNNETLKESPKANHIEKLNQTSSYMNIMNELIDSKNLENITDKYSKTKVSESTNDVNSDTNSKYGRRLTSRTNSNFMNEVIEVKNIGKKPIVIDTYDTSMQIATNKFRPNKTSLKNLRPKTTVSSSQKNKDSNDKSFKTINSKQRAGTAPNSVDYKSKTPIYSYQVNANGTITMNSNSDNHYTLSDYHKELLMLAQEKKKSSVTTSQILADKLKSAPIVETEVLQTNKNSFGDVKLLEGHWKDQLLNRGSYLQKRPKYNVRIDPEKIKPDPPAIELHTNASETYFYNTLPFRKATFTINPHFISENLNVKKMGLQNRLSGSQTNNNIFGPVKFRKDYAFVY